MTRTKLLKMYGTMLTLRHCDERFYELKTKDIIMNGFHPYIGQEAVATGVCAALKKQDAMTSTHRPQGHALAKGSKVKRIFCEMLGRRGGVSEGMGGPMQWIDAENLFFCGSIVGSGIPIATGIALAQKQQKTGGVCVCFFGDGACNTGAFHEGLNLAAIWKLPVVFVLENNQFGEAMPAEEFVACHPISKRAVAYEMRGVTVDGNDVQAVFAAADEAVKLARSGGGPSLIEAVTYRFRGHYIGDPEHTYRTKEEVEAWRKKCPVGKTRARLLELGCSEAELDELEHDITARIETDEAWAVDQPFFTVEDAMGKVMVPVGERR